MTQFIRLHRLSGLEILINVAKIVSIYASDKHCWITLDTSEDNEGNIHIEETYEQVWYALNYLSSIQGCVSLEESAKVAEYQAGLKQATTEE